jgi:hypothetical protein
MNLMDAVVEARAQWYTNNMQQRPWHRTADPNNAAQQNHVQLEPTEQALLDKYDSTTLAIVAHSRRFAFDVNTVANTAAAIDAAYAALVQDLDPEFSTTNTHIRDEELRAAYTNSSKLPEPLPGLASLFSKEYVVATSQHIAQLQNLYILPGDSGAGYISQFRDLMDLVDTNPHIRPTPALLYTWALKAIKKHRNDAYNHCNSRMLALHPLEHNQTVENLFPIALQYFANEQKRKDMASFSEERTVSFTTPHTTKTSPTRTKTYSSPPTRGRGGRNNNHSYYTGRGYQQAHNHQSHYNNPSHHQQDDNCNYCHQSHAGYDCPLKTRGAPPPGWQVPPKESPLYALYMMLRQEPNTQQQARHAPIAPATDYKQQPPPRSYGKPNPKGSHFTAAAEGPGRQASGGERDDAFDACCMADVCPPGESLATTRAQTTQRAPAANPQPPVTQNPTTSPAVTPTAPLPATHPISRRPAPLGFAPTTMPRDVPMSQLPTAVRSARQRASAISSQQQPFTLPSAATERTTPAAPRLTISLLELLSLGSNVAEQTLAQTPAVLVHGLSSTLVSIPLENMAIDISTLPHATRKQLLIAYSQLDTEPVMPTSSTTPTTPTNPQPASTPTPAEPLSFTAAEIQPCTPRSHQSDESLAADLQSIEDGPDPTMPALFSPGTFQHDSDTDTSLHATTPACTTTSPPPDRAIPCIHTLSPIPSLSATLTHAETGEQLLSEDHSLRIIVDSASTLNLIPLALAEHMSLEYSNPTPMRTSSGAIAHTLGRVTSPVAITMCYDDPSARVSVLLDLDVVDCNSDSFDLLLGVQWMDALAVQTRTAPPSQLTYFTQYPTLREEIGPVTIPLITHRD